MIKVGMIVRYTPEWCSDGEREYLHIVKENRLNPVDNTMTRWLIETINMKSMHFHPSSVVDECMIESIKVTKVNAIYTGGGIWAFCGSLDDGTFFLTDDYGSTLILNEDPNADFEEACFPEWQEEHLVRELDGEERKQFCYDMLSLLSAYPSNSIENGGISEMEIERYIKSMTEDI